jgi:hypothetical protein
LVRVPPETSIGIGLNRLIIRSRTGSDKTTRSGVRTRSRVARVAKSECGITFE